MLVVSRLVVWQLSLFDILPGSEQTPGRTGSVTQPRIQTVEANGSNGSNVELNNAVSLVQLVLWTKMTSYRVVSGQQ